MKLRDHHCGYYFLWDLVDFWREARAHLCASAHGPANG